MLVEIISDTEGPSSVTPSAVGHALPSWLCTNERQQHNLEPVWNPYQEAQNTKKPDLVQTKTTDALQNLIHSESHSWVKKNIYPKVKF